MLYAIRQFFRFADYQALIPAGLAGNDVDTRFGDTQRAGKKIYQVFIGPAFNGRGFYSYFYLLAQSATQGLGKFIAGRTCLYAYVQNKVIVQPLEERQMITATGRNKAPGV